MPFLPIDIQLGERTPEAPHAPAGVFRTRSYIDPLMMELQGGVTSSNFQVVKLASMDRNGVPFFNDIVKWQEPDYQYLLEMQYDEGGEFGSVAQKMNWLCNHDLDESGTPSRPYWIKNGKFRFGTILFGEQSCRVEVDATGKPVEYIHRGKYPARLTDEWITFYRVVGMRRYEMATVSHETHPWLVQQCTAIEGGKGTDRPRGVVHFHPVWSDIDWPTNYGDGRLYVAREFLTTPTDPHPAPPKIRESAEFGGGG